MSDRPACVGSGKRPTRYRFVYGFVVCPWCDARVYLTQKGTLYKHREKQGVDA